MATTEYAMKLRGQLNALRQNIRAAAQVAHMSWAQLGVDTRQLRQLREQEPNWGLGATRHAVRDSLALAALPACYVIDVLMLAAPTEFLATTAFGDNLALVGASRFLAPLAVLLLDLLIGSELAHLAENSDGRREVPRAATLALGLLWACVMPIAVIATNIIQFGNWSSMLLGNKMLTGFQAALGLTAHAAVVLCARQMGEAKAHALHSWRTMLLERKAARHLRRYRTQQLKAHALFDRLRSAAPEGDQSLTFDETTVRVLNDQLPIPDLENGPSRDAQEIAGVIPAIEFDAGGTARAESMQAQPEPVSAADEVSRLLIEQHRDVESQVRP